MNSAKTTTSAPRSGTPDAPAAIACSRLETKVDALDQRLERIEMMMFLSVAMMRLHERSKVRQAAAIPAR